jgi:hypothetical protein
MMTENMDNVIHPGKHGNPTQATRGKSPRNKEEKIKSGASFCV